MEYTCKKCGIPYETTLMGYKYTNGKCPDCRIRGKTMKQHRALDIDDLIIGYIHRTRKSHKSQLKTQGFSYYRNR